MGEVLYTENHPLELLFRMITNNIDINKYDDLSKKILYNRIVDYIRDVYTYISENENNPDLGELCRFIANYK